MVVQRNNEKGEYEEVTLTVTLGAKKDMPESSTEESTTESGTAKNDDSNSSSEGDNNGQYMTPDEFFEEYGNFFGN
jgi:hypothetical protein